MSYSIIYGNIGVDLQNGEKLIMLLSGSNNCTEVVNGREVRERSWFPITVNGKMALTEDVLGEYVEQLTNDESSGIVKNSKWLSNRDYGRLLLRTFKNAKTIEEIIATAKFPLMPYLCGQVFDEVSKKPIIDERLNTTVKINDYLYTAMKYKTARLGQEANGNQFTTSIHFLNREQIVLKKPLSSLVETDKDVVIKRRKVGYVEYLTEFSGSYSSKLTEKIPVYNGSEEAKDYLKKKKRDVSDFEIVVFKEENVAKYNIELFDNELGATEGSIGYLYKCVKNGTRYVSYQSSAPLFSKKQFKKYEKSGSLLSSKIKSIKLVESN